MKGSDDPVKALSRLFERIDNKLNLLIVMVPTGFMILAWLILSKT